MLIIPNDIISHKLKALRKRLGIFVSIVMSGILIVSCDYAPSGKPITVKNHPDSTGLSIDLGQIKETDTIFLFDNVQISYQSILPGAQKIKLVRAYINNDLVLIGENSDGSFSLQPGNYPPGIYQLRLELVTSSGTGSLADVTGNEEFKITRHYVLALDASDPDTPTIKSISNDDGSIKVVWEKYKKFNFEKYTLTKFYYSNHPLSPGYFAYYSKTFTDKNITSFHDSTFIGGNIQFSLTVTAGSHSSSTVYQQATFPYDPDLHVEWVGKSQIKFTWRKTPFYKNLAFYQVNISDDTRILQTKNASDTTLIVDPLVLFPSARQTNVIAYPYQLLNDRSLNFIYSNSQFYLGNIFPGSTLEFIYNPTLDKYFSLAGPTLAKINGQTLELEQSTATDATNIVMSDNGQYLYATKGDVMYQLDPSSLNTIKVMDLSTIHGSNSGDDWRVTIANNNIAAMSNIQGNFIVDLNSLSIIQTFTYPESVVKISPDGSYLLRRGPINGQISKWNGTQFVDAYSFNSTNLMDGFFRASQTAMIVTNGSILIIDLASMTLTRSIPSNAFNVNYDPVSGLLGGVSDPYIGGASTFYLFSPDNDVMLKQFPIASGGTVTLLNNSLNSGYLVLPLSYYYP